jgi:hydrogenase nickel incorporation protein HypA/HybF
MHELSIATALVKQILEFAIQHNAESIQEVEVEVGLLRRIAPQALQLGFEAAGNQTIAEGAVLKIIEISPLAKCRICGKTFEPEIHNFLCSNCNKAKVEILQGDDIVLKSIDYKQKD